MSNNSVMLNFKVYCCKFHKKLWEVSLCKAVMQPAYIPDQTPALVLLKLDAWLSLYNEHS